MTHQQTADTKGPVFDQFALADQVGIVNSNRMMKILRNVRKYGPIVEGLLAGKCAERMFFPEWSQYINTLLQWGWIEAKPTGKGTFRNLTITSVGEEFMEYKTGPKEVEPTTEVA